MITITRKNDIKVLSGTCPNCGRHIVCVDEESAEGNTPASLGLAGSCPECDHQVRILPMAEGTAAPEEPEEVLPIFPITEGDVFCCTRDCPVFNADGSGYIAYTGGKTYTSEKDGCITDDQGRTDHEWSPGFFGSMAGNFFRKVSHGIKPVMEGSWVVVHDEQTCRVVNVIGDTLVVAVPSLLSTVLMSCRVADVRPWKPADAREGDFLAADLEAGHKAVFITKGYGKDVFESFAGYSTLHGSFWTESNCCNAYKDKIRPATEEEKLLLKEQAGAHGLRWNPDRMKMEKAEEETDVVTKAFPDLCYEQLLKKVEELKERFRELEGCVAAIKGKDMPSGDDSNV